VVDLQSDAARIDDQPPILEPHRARDVRMPTQHYGIVEALGLGCHRRLVRLRHRAPLPPAVEPGIHVGRRGAVTEEDIVEQGKIRRQRIDPGAMPRFHLELRELVDLAKLVRRVVDQLALMIAAHRGDIDVHEDIGHPVGLERPRDKIAEIEDPVDLVQGNVVQHRLERETVAMDVGNDCDLHAAGGAPALSAATSALRALSSALWACTSSRSAS